jgi:hypothetical protein
MRAGRVKGGFARRSRPVDPADRDASGAERVMKD